MINAPRQIAERQDPFYEHKRAVANAFLGVQEWRTLSKHICKDSFDVAVLMARRVPRVRELLGADFLKEVPLVVSSFAIDFMGDSLKGKKIAVVDDTINVGSSFKDVCMKLVDKGAQEYECFCIAKKANDHSLNDSEDLHVTCVREALLSEDEYHAYSLNITRAISLLNKPYEIEFPELRLAYIPELPERLVRAYGTRVHRLDTLDGAQWGLERFSVDMGKDGAKCRFYMDSAKKEIIAVPMVPPSVTNKITRDARLHMFQNPLQVGLMWLSELGVKVQGIIEEDINLLFGPGAAEEYQLSDRPQGRQPSSEQSALPLREGMLTLAQKILDPTLQTLERKVIELFTEFGKRLKEDSCPVPRRLQHGFTLPELAKVLGQDSYGALSAVVDRQVDQGFLVPVLDRHGRRVFRKGEPQPYESSMVFLLRNMGYPVEPENCLEVFDSLKPELQKVISDAIASC